MTPIHEACEAMEAAKQAYLEEYECEGETDEGARVTYYYTEFEKRLIEDAIDGLLADQKFLDAFNEWQRRITTTHNQK